jgi:hypothetical protein
MKRLLVLVLVAMEVNRVSAAAPQLSIVRVDDFSGNEARAFVLLQRRLQRWVENHVGIQAEVSSAKISNDEFKRAEYRAELAGLIKKIRLFANGEIEQADISALLRDVPLVRDRLRANVADLPLLQESYYWEASAYWHLGDRKTAEKRMEKGARLHPQGLFLTEGEWDEVSVRPAGFQAFIDSMAVKFVRSCKLEILGDQALHDIRLDGFSLSGKSPYSLLGGRLYRLSVDGEESLVHCQRHSMSSVKLESSPRALVRAKAKEKLYPMLLVKAEKERFRLFLFSPEKGVDEFPLEKPLTVANVTIASADAPVPLLSDAAAGLFRKHQLVAQSLTELPNEGEKVAVQNLSVDQSASTAWYNSWVFWTIAGGLVAGGVATYLATKKDSPVSTQTKLSGRLQ